MFWQVQSEAKTKNDISSDNETVKSDVVSEATENNIYDLDENSKTLISSKNLDSAVEKVPLNSEEELTSSEEELSDEDYAEEEEEEEEIEESEELLELRETIKKYKQDKQEFFSSTRKVFIEEWLYTNGNWLSELSIDHLNFLRDILDIQKNHQGWPQYTP
ncbi:MAG: hypothetical protein GY823_05890 [Flavobacteriaceae bacterium]|nr:hypothetical protein [Flavobacteriaceae bacterium]